MKKTIHILTIISFLIYPCFVNADGGFIPYNHEDIYEPSQVAFIIYDDKQEDIFLKVNYEGETNKFVWVIPTPSFPIAKKSPKDLFKDLSEYTIYSSQYDPRDAKAGADHNDELGDTNVIVHSQQHIGVFEITVLSATGVNGLYEWLNNNEYNVSEEVKGILDWYIQKEWYFTAVRIDPEENIKQFVEEVKKINNTTTESNAKEILSQYFIDAAKQINYTNFKKALDIIGILVPDFKEEIEELFGSEAEFKLLAEAEGFKDYTDEEWLEEREEIENVIDNGLKSNSKDTINTYSNYLNPIKISFQSNSLVYPLKISQLSTRVPENENVSPKTNEVLLYIATDKYVEAPNFENEFTGKISPSLVEDYENLGEVIKKEYNLTKIRRDFAREEMDEDVYFIESDGKESITELIIPLSQSYKSEPSYIENKDKIVGSAMADRLKGKIVLKVEANGEAYYINPITKYIHYLGRPADAFSLMREQGVGITNNNLYKIPVGIITEGYQDSDQDGLSDYLEDTLGLNKNSSDTDNDGHKDGVELENGYNPWDSGKQPIDNNFAKAQAGKIFLQVEKNGEAWYVSPSDNKRYFLGRPNDAFQVMRSLGLGISNSDFDNL